MLAIHSFQFSCSVVSDSLQPYELEHTRPPCPSPTPRVYSNSCVIELVMPSNHLILYPPLLLLPSIFPSIKVFSNESVLQIRWPKYWSFSFSISPSNEYSVPISFRIDGFDLLAVLSPRVSKGLKSLPKNHSSKESIHSVHFSSVNQLCPPFCDPMNCSTPGLPVHHQLPEITQTHVH